MNYRVTHTTKYAYTEAVPVCHNLVHLLPRSMGRQTCEGFHLLIHPEPADLSHRDDYFGNGVSYFSIDQAHRGLTITATSQVSVSPKPDPLAKSTPPWEAVINQLRSGRSAKEIEAFQFVLPSPGVQAFGKLADYAAPSFQPGRPILDAVLDLTARVHTDFNYDPRATTIHTPIHEVFQKRQGVCQDFAHLQIGCLRALGLAARYVSGYLRTHPPPGEPRLIGADASHAWLAVYCGDAAGWIDVDPTNNAVTSTDHITLAWGRDYNDVCPVQGVIVGGGNHQLHVSVDVEDGAPR